jgi:hypothetical protein
MLNNTTNRLQFTNVLEYEVDAMSAQGEQNIEGNSSINNFPATT